MNPNRIPVAMALAAVLLGSAAALGYAQQRDLIGEELATRITQALIGVVLAMSANAAPKEIGRMRSIRSARRAQAVTRLGGWLMTLAGLAYAALWLLAPQDLAAVASMTLVAAALVVTLAYAGWTYVQCRRDESADELPAQRHT